MQEHFVKKSAIDWFIVMSISRWFRIKYISSVRVAGFICCTVQETVINLSVIQ